MANVRISIESARGCGYRKAGGIYLVSGGVMAECGRLPIKLDVCPTCNHGIKPARGWTWIDVRAMLGLTEVELCSMDHCRSCPANGSVDRAGLLWIGEQFYPTPQVFLKEANEMGVSRRISAVPTDFEVGKTWVFFAHRKTFKDNCPECFGAGLFEDDDCPVCQGDGSVYTAGAFHAFKPTAIEYVIKGDGTEQLDALEKRGFSLVKVIKSGGPLLEGQPVEDNDE